MQLSYEKICELIGLTHNMIHETTRILENLRRMHFLFSIGYAYHIKVRELLRLVTEALTIRIPTLSINDLRKSLLVMLISWAPTLARAYEEVLNEMYSIIKATRDHSELSPNEARRLIECLSKMAELKAVLLHLLAIELEWYLRQHQQLGKLFIAEVLREAARGFENYRELTLELSTYL